MTPVSAPCTDTPAEGVAGLVSRRVPFDAIPRPAWDRLLAVTARATPFSRWTFHRAWWDAYSETAHEEYLVCLRSGSPSAQAGADLQADDMVAIVPLMHRHEVEPDDTLTRTVMRQAAREPATRVPPLAKAVFFAASYHADYATVLCDPADLPQVAARLIDCLASGPDLSHDAVPWDVVDLRRLRDDDPALPALETAFRAAAEEHGWAVLREQEDVCPVLHLGSADWDAYLQGLGKKERHEVRRKLRRAEGAGEIRFETIPELTSFVDDFVAIHQARWGDDGLFPDTPGGARSRRFLQRLAELEGADGAFQFGRLMVGDRMIFATAAFVQNGVCYFYNAGASPEARDLSPGVVGVAAYLQDRMANGCLTFDFLRGNEPYKYEWGAVDQPIHRLLISRA